jgi:hypothetical protein
VLHYWLENNLIKSIVLLLLFWAVILQTQTLEISEQRDNYDLQLIRFYLEKNEYETVVNYIEYLEQENYVSDSLKYYQALSYKGLRNWEKTSELFSLLIIHSPNEALKDLSLSQLEDCLSRLEIINRIEIISEIINELKDDDYRINLLFLLAEIYEEAHLFEEANDVYNTILSETEAQEKFQLDLKIAANYIFLKDYNSALTILDPIISLQDSLLNENALFLCYIANYTLNRVDTARNCLIQLYLHYPHHKNRNEIINSLAEILFQEKHYLISWYLYHDLRRISNPSQAYNIDLQIRKIKKLISTESELPDQFKYLSPDF